MSTANTKMQKTEPETTHEPLCKKQRHGQDSCSTGGDEEQWSSDRSTSSNEMPDKEAKSLIAFLQMKSLCSKRVVRPR